jgi:hypothetical protein
MQGKYTISSSQTFFFLSFFFFFFFFLWPYSEINIFVLLFAGELQLCAVSFLFRNISNTNNAFQTCILCQLTAKRHFHGFSQSLQVSAMIIPCCRLTAVSMQVFTYDECPIFLYHLMPFVYNFAAEIGSLNLRICMYCPYSSK